MDEINSVLNSRNLQKKNINSRKIKNLKQNFNDTHKNEYNIFQSKCGKTEKSSPIHFHNKIIGFVKNNKTNLNIQSMISKYNKNIKLEISKNISKSKSNPRSNSKSKKSNPKKELSRNTKKDSSKFNKINLKKKLNNISNNSIKSKHFYESKTQNNSNNQTKIINKSKKGKENKNKIVQRNLLFNNNNSNKNNNSNFNLVSATKQTHNLKVMKMINNILTKKKKNEIKYPITTINSRKNTNSKEKKNSKNKNNNNNITQHINRIRNIYNNNNFLIWRL